MTENINASRRKFFSQAAKAAGGAAVVAAGASTLVQAAGGSIVQELPPEPIVLEKIVEKEVEALAPPTLRFLGVRGSYIHIKVRDANDDPVNYFARDLSGVDLRLALDRTGEIHVSVKKAKSWRAEWVDHVVVVEEGEVVDITI